MRRHHRWFAAQHPATPIAFDVLRLDGRAVRVLPCHARRELFERACLTVADAGLVDVEIRPTHRVHEHAGSAIIRARKP